MGQAPSGQPGSRAQRVTFQMFFPLPVTSISSPPSCGPGWVWEQPRLGVAGWWWSRVDTRTPLPSSEPSWG